MTATSDDPRAQAWHDGKVVIQAVLAEGPSAGGTVMCITKRQIIRTGIKRATSSMRAPGFRASLIGAIHRQVRRGIDGLSPANDQNFMDDLAILMCVKIVRGGDEGVLDGSGLFSLHLAVHPDASLPWFQRGLIEKADGAIPGSAMAHEC